METGFFKHLWRFNAICIALVLIAALTDIASLAQSALAARERGSATIKRASYS
ncbi:MAG: hypothetical protein AAGI13_10860 [Pseudomonadota bacterium]